MRPSTATTRRLKVALLLLSCLALTAFLIGLDGTAVDLLPAALLFAVIMIRPDTGIDLIIGLSRRLRRRDDATAGQRLRSPLRVDRGLGWISPVLRGRSPPALSGCL